MGLGVDEGREGTIFSRGEASKESEKKTRKVLLRKSQRRFCRFSSQNGNDILYVVIELLATDIGVDTIENGPFKIQILYFLPFSSSPDPCQIRSNNLK